MLTTYRVCTVFSSTCALPSSLIQDFETASNNLGVLRLREGKIEGAVGHFREALRVQPDYAGAGFNLKKALSIAGFKEKTPYDRRQF